MKRKLSKGKLIPFRTRTRRRVRLSAPATIKYYPLRLIITALVLSLVIIALAHLKI